jgi:hypothetical protein
MVRKSVGYFFALIVTLSAPMAMVMAATAWMGPGYNLGLPHVNQTGQTVSSSMDLSLQHDTPCDVTIHLQRAGGEVLTGPGGATLTTSYMLTGDALLTPDVDWVSSTDFSNRLYHIKTNGPTNDVLHLAVQGQSPTGRAVPAGDYTTAFSLTVTW